VAVQMKPGQTVRGEIGAVNEKGIRIADQWWNFSRYHAVPHPYRDELVELSVTEGAPGSRRWSWSRTARASACYASRSPSRPRSRLTASPSGP
jgi:hypothetical protein